MPPWCLGAGVFALWRGAEEIVLTNQEKIRFWGDLIGGLHLAGTYREFKKEIGSGFCSGIWWDDKWQQTQSDMFRRGDLPPYEDSQALGQAAWRDYPVSILRDFQGWNKDLSNLAGVHGWAHFEQEVPSHITCSATQWTCNTIQQSLYMQVLVACSPFSNTSPWSDTVAH